MPRPKRKTRSVGTPKTTECTQCEHCNSILKNALLLRKHLKKCKMNIKSLEPIKPVFSCKECTKKYKFKATFLAHLKNEHSKEPGSVACSHCHVRCPNEEVLKNHVATIHEQPIYSCPHCEQQFVRHYHVARHMAQTGCDGNGVSIYPCSICNAQFSRKDNLMVHLRLQHITRKEFQCKQCDFSTKSFSKLCVHHQVNHTDGKPTYECDICSKVTSSRASMTKHLEIHGEKKYECDVCKFSSFTVEVMRRHVLTHVKDKPYKCEICEKSFIQPLQLRAHLKKHEENTCSECGDVFKSKLSLMVHQRTHLNSEKVGGQVKNAKTVCPHEDCVDSDATYRNENELRRHLKQQHTNDEKPYRCEVCGKEYSKLTNLRRHVAAHTLERARRCMYCVLPRAYVRGMQLVRHVRMAHPTVFKDHLTHVRSVLGTTLQSDRVKHSELESILNVLDAEADRILEGYGEGVLYGGMMDAADAADAEQEPEAAPANVKAEHNPLMSEEELSENLNKLLVQLIDKEALECFGWPNEPVDTVLEKVIENCGAKPAAHGRWPRVQRLRENAKHLFLYAVEDKNIARMLATHTIDQVVKHILTVTVEDE